MAAAYSMDLRKRVFEDCDAGVASKDVAAKFRVSRSWIDRVKQRRRETGEVTPRPQTVFKPQAWINSWTAMNNLTPSPARRLMNVKSPVGRFTAAWICGLVGTKTKALRIRAG